MTMFGSGSLFGTAQTAAARPGAVTSSNPMKDIEVVSPPDDSVSCLEFSPSTIPQTFLIAGSWDNNIRCWQVMQNTGNTEPKAQQTLTAPVLDCCWSQQGDRVYVAGCDNAARCWDLGSNQIVQVAQHDAPVVTCHWIQAPNYTCLMTGSWDKTLKFWDTRSPSAMLTIALPERCYCADVQYPMAVVSTANRHTLLYQLEGQPQMIKTQELTLRYQHRCVAVFRDRQRRTPTGYAMGSVEGRVAIQYVNSMNPKDNFTFKCHRSILANSCQDVFAVNDIKFHPVHGTLATVGADGRFYFWDKDSRTKLKMSEQMEQPITKCAFDHTGQIFAYAVCYDWSKGHEFYNAANKSRIFLHGVSEEMKPRTKA